MATNPRFVKVFEQVKMNLHLLYGAGYFTEKQWSNIDYWINKENYLWTEGPRTETLLDQSDELMSFDDATPRTESKTTVEDHPFELKAQNPIFITEKEISSPDIFSSITESSDAPEQTPSGTSAEASSDEEPTVQDNFPEIPDDFMIGPATPEPVAEPPRQPVEIPRPTGLPQGITQTQLDEAKALTMAFKTGTLKDSHRNKKRSVLSNYEEDFDYPSPTASEQDTQIQSWASGVSKPAIASPHTALAKTLDEQAQSAIRPSSRVSNSSALSKASTALANGLILQAKYDQIKTSQIILDVHAGDSLKILKYVSGKMWTAVNLRNSQSGQVNADIFGKDLSAALTAVIEKSRKTVSSPVQANSHMGTLQGHIVDGFEASNAAEWDDIPQHRAMVAPTPQTKPRPPIGLASSRFAILPDSGEVSKRESMEQERGMTKSQVEQISELFDTKLAQILAAQKSRSSINMPSRVPSRGSWRRPAEKPVKEAYKTPDPKTVTCWFWHMKNANPHKDGCRYSDADCWNLHFYPNGPENVDLPLKDGLPIWAALADAEPAVIPSGKRSQTCWYWATRGKCANSAEKCLYMHAYARGGVAPRPWGTRHGRNPSEKEQEWDPSESVNSWEQNENVAPQVSAWDTTQSRVSGWETPMIIDDAKTTVVEQLEEQAQRNDVW